MMTYKRRLENVDFDYLWPTIMELETNHVLPMGPLDEFQNKYYPELDGRTALNLVVIVREIYREVAFRKYIDGET